MPKFTKGSAAAKAAGRKGALATNARRKISGYKPPKTEVMNTYYMLCIDASGSMTGFEKQVEATIQQQLNLIALNKTGNTFVSIYDFGAKPLAGVSQVLFKTDPTKAVYRGYEPWGSTPLFDCLGQAIEDHTGFEKPGSKDAAIVILITDGEENSSQKYDSHSGKIEALIKKVQGTDQWTIAAYVPYGYVRNMTSLGIPPGNVKEWERSERGFRDMRTTNVGSTMSYTVDRARGVTMSANYFTPNLAKLKTTKVKKNLTDRSKDFKTWTVEKESSIQEFVESKGRPFVVGAGYYPLTKTEKVQKTKQVALVKKGSKEVYTGAEARDLLGLPDADVKVTPGNHGEWDIYVQSTSHNRKLVRGTKLLWDLSHTVDSKHTWVK